MTKATRELLLFSFIRTLILFMKVLPSWPNISPEVPRPNTISLSTRFQHINFGEKKHSVCIQVWRTFLVAQMVKHLPTMQETRVQSLDREDLLEKEMATHSSILPGKSHGQRSLAGYSPQRSQTVGHDRALNLPLWNPLLARHSWVLWHWTQASCLCPRAEEM